MKDLLLPLLHLAVTAAKLCRPGGVRAVIAENLLLKQQLIVLRRSRQRAPNLRVGDRLRRPCHRRRRSEKSSATSLLRMGAPRSAWIVSCCGG